MQIGSLWLLGAACLSSSEASILFETEFAMRWVCSRQENNSALVSQESGKEACNPCTSANIAVFVKSFVHHRRRTVTGRCAEEQCQTGPHF
ncbi:hypothetical protein C8Q76DRAFT_700349 [Earliella scabrosa]|nr:hypothetical protein C8Q76DRAFT_700349 [Earliella scabrosa]